MQITRTEKKNNLVPRGSLLPVFKSRRFVTFVLYPYSLFFYTQCIAHFGGLCCKISGKYNSPLFLFLFSLFFFPITHPGDFYLLLENLYVRLFEQRNRASPLSARIRVFATGALDSFLQSPSLLISGSGSWPQLSLSRLLLPQKAQKIGRALAPRLWKNVMGSRLDTAPLICRFPLNRPEMFANWPETFAKRPLAKRPVTNWAQLVGKSTRALSTLATSLLKYSHLQIFE